MVARSSGGHRSRARSALAGCVHFRRERRVVEPVDLEGEEQQAPAQVGQALHRVLIEPSAHRIVGLVAGLVQLGIAADLAEDFADILVFGDRRAESRTVQIRDFAAMAFEIRNTCLDRGEVGLRSPPSGPL